MMLALVLGLVLTAPPNARLNYENKCLYCHSEEVTESKRFTEPQWRRVIEQMRAKAPLLITRGDVGRLTRYVTQTLKLVAPPHTSALEPKPPASQSGPVIPTQPFPSLPMTAWPTPVPFPTPVGEELTAVDIASEQTAFDLMQHRCSKCHTLDRVYGRLDTFERSMATLERMRLKTGSGITDFEMKLLQDYLRTQF